MHRNIFLDRKAVFDVSETDPKIGLKPRDCLQTRKNWLKNPRLTISAFWAAVGLSAHRASNWAYSILGRTPVAFSQISRRLAERSVERRSRDAQCVRDLRSRRFRIRQQPLGMTKLLRGQLGRATNPGTLEQQVRGDVRLATIGVSDTGACDSQPLESVTSMAWPAEQRFIA